MHDCRGGCSPWAGDRHVSQASSDPPSGRAERPTPWLYGQRDPFYLIAHSRDNFAAFEKAGGNGQFLEFEAQAGQGHFILGRPNLWPGPIDSYLKSLAPPGER